jgi:hypothetical protein
MGAVQGSSSLAVYCSSIEYWPALSGRPGPDTRIACRHRTIPILLKLRCNRAFVMGHIILIADVRRRIVLARRSRYASVDAEPRGSNPQFTTPTVTAQEFA